MYPIAYRLKALKILVPALHKIAIFRKLVVWYNFALLSQKRASLALAIDIF